MNPLYLCHEPLETPVKMQVWGTGGAGLSVQPVLFIAEEDILLPL